MDMDDVQELVRRVRQKYVDQFVSAVGELAANSQGSHTTEVKFLNVDSFYRNFIAVDFVANDGQPNPQFINSDTYLKFSPDIRAEIGGMDVIISPFKWDEVHFKFDTKDLDDDLFDEWFRTWFDIDGERETMEIVGNIIHSTQLLDGQLTVDFGTADVDAFWHLLQILSRSGVRSLAIGTDDIAQPLN
ncbi:hypothetical protein [Mesorhizobium sp.]|uniref:hypothetical protein n=2 Tax=Mesorhizobium sp. TaxID=1871066 RepID=UPI000FEAAF9F|nr:hypothetical protein [Mesorhizobium sp.]RWI23795.1 MAG: hypothetical protein EOQ92_13915 [Mesorhizobium sp.]RWK48200.1 MAG: hypothetical protein EOR47_19140 [Mesorhizobium sp.]RWK91744.1 MAG: hypothetical protein EOR53_27880 [Mesorhizobium sp.]TIQ31421.1 MAG: hypothetical protein E5X54_06435 [Mesorhizobium sp.]TIQ88459.1 MAG: hypothetical protein E5X44_23985 [Mesorhizobium sp.]